MNNHPRRAIVANAKRAAITAGWSIREGSYIGTNDDCVGRWYTIHESDDVLRPYGRGYGSKGEAWIAAAEQAADNACLVGMTE